MFDLLNLAYAMGQTGEKGAPSGGSPGSLFIPMILMIVIFYLLVFRPQQKKTKEHQEMVNNLKKGDKVITSGGIHGTVVNTAPDHVSLEIADRVRIKVVRGNIAVLTNEKGEAPAAKK